MKLLWGVLSSVGANPLRASNNAAFSHPATMSLAGNDAELAEKEGVVNFVERRCQIRVQDPRPPRLALQRVVERHGRVLAAAPRPELVELRASNRASHSGSSACLTRAWRHR